jgi:peptide/nickel transport system permease protein
VRYLVSKVVAAVVTFAIAVSLAVVLSNVGGDPVANLLGPLAPKEQVEAERTALGLDRPLPVQIVSTLGNVARGDLGTSLRYNESCWSIIESRLPRSLELMIAAMLLGTFLGIPLGVVAALRENSFLDRFTMTIALAGQSVPLYWLGMIAVLVFSVQLGWLPAGRAGGWTHLVLPAIVLAMLPMGRIARLTRASMSRVLDEDYILAARARGLSSFRTIVVHALRNAALPVVTIIGLQAGVLISGAVTVEVVFAWPGLGSLAVDAVSFRDFRLVQAIVIFGAFVFVTINLLVDLLYGMLDPRIRHAQ